MSFSTLMYHEIRKEKEFNPEHPYRIQMWDKVMMIFCPHHFLSL